MKKTIDKDLEEIDEDGLYLLGLPKGENGNMTEEYLIEVEKYTNITRKEYLKIKKKREKREKRVSNESSK